MTYQTHPRAPGYWLYDGSPIQADVETHQYVLRTAQQRLPPQAPILDVAAGHGALTKALIDAGFALSCTSWNGRFDLPIPTYNIDLDKSFAVGDVGGRRFSMVCAIEIIEHVENPAQLLRSFADLLEPGGLLVLSTPNVESAWARMEWLLRGCPYSFDGHEITRNRHISILWRQGLETFISLAGLTILEKELSGKLRYRGWVQQFVKKPLHALMKMSLKGDLEGNSRTYLLQRNHAQPRSLGADDVA